MSVPFKVGSFKLKIFNWIKKEDLFSFSFFRDFVKKKQISWSYPKHLWCCYKFLEEILKIGQKMFQSLHSFLKILTTREKKLLHLKLNQQKKIFLSTTKFCILWKILERRYLTETSNFRKLLAAERRTGDDFRDKITGKRRRNRVVLGRAMHAVFETNGNLYLPRIYAAL